MSIKYYATEEYVDAKVASAGGNSILPEAGASQYLTTDEFGNVQWEDKLLYKGNRTVHIIHSDDATDRGEDDDFGRYSITLSLSAAGHINPSPANTISYPLTIYFDGEPCIITGRALPIALSNPTSKIIYLTLSNNNKGINMGMSFDEPGEHILIIENGEDFYTKLDYGYMPDGYPTVMQNYTSLTGVTARGTISDDGQIYSYNFSNLQLAHKQLYRVKFNQIDYFVTAQEVSAEQIVIGNTAAPYTTPPFCIIYDTVALKSTLYWNASGEANVPVSVVKIEDVLTPLDEKFLPEHQHTTSWNDLEDKPFGVKTELIAAIPERDYTFNSIGGGIYFKQVGPYPMLDYNKQKYIVMMNNERYDCIPKAGYTDDSGTLRCLLGNETFDSDIENAQDTGEPFFIYSDPSGYTNILVNAKGPHRVGVYEAQEIITPLDVEFLPEHTHSIEQGGTGQTSIVDTIYTEPRYRASALVSTETTPTSNGVITWIYE